MEAESKYLKLCFENQIKRIMFPSNYSNLIMSIIESLSENLKYSDVPLLNISYKDEEGDSITISNQFDFDQTRLYMTSEKHKSLKLNISIIKKESEVVAAFLYKPQCAACNMKEISGVRWKCHVCPGVNFCDNCVTSDNFSHVHSLIKIKILDDGKFEITDSETSEKNERKFDGKEDLHSENYYRMKRLEIEGNSFENFYMKELKGKRKSLPVSRKLKKDQKDNNYSVNKMWKEYSLQFRESMKKMKEQGNVNLKYLCVLSAA